MSKCNKAKNPCKICLGSVTLKNGLKCQGACQTWVHFNCLNYTPGKIKDIKAGIIKVTCPCPDCRTTLPKEYRTDEPYSCNNSQCPANRPPRCENTQCPTNEGSTRQTIRPSPCPLSKCGSDCKQFSTQQSVCSMPLPPCDNSNGGSMTPISSSDACLSQGSKCPSGCTSLQNIPAEASVEPSCHIVEQMCNTVGQLTNQINELMLKMKQAVKDKSGGGGFSAAQKTSCQQTGPKSMCPKPCFCPGNPGKR